MKAGLPHLTSILLLVCCPHFITSSGYYYGSIKASVAVLTSFKPSAISCQMCSVLSSCVSTSTKPIISHLFCCPLHMLPLSLSDPLIRTDLPFLLRYTTKVPGHRFLVCQAFAFQSGGHCCRYGQVTAHHCLGPPIFRFERPRHPQLCMFWFRVAGFFSQGYQICSSWGRRILFQASFLCYLLGVAHRKIVLGAPCSAQADVCAFSIVV